MNLILEYQKIKQFLLYLLTSKTLNTNFANK